jgi:hypothetical protein
MDEQSEQRDPQTGKSGDASYLWPISLSVGLAVGAGIGAAIGRIGAGVGFGVGVGAAVGLFLLRRAGAASKGR